MPQPFPFDLNHDPASLPPKEWIVEGLFARGEVTCLAAPPMLFKSMLATHLSVSVATGQSWFGRPTFAGAVIYIAGERENVTKRRIAAHAAQIGTPRLPIAVIGPGYINLVERPDDVDRLVETTRAVEAATGMSVRLIIFDTLRRAVMPGGDENRSGDMSRATDALARLSRLVSCHVVVIHHVPKHSKTEASGNNALLGLVDTMIVIEQRQGTPAWRVISANDLPGHPAGAFAVQEVEMEGERTAIISSASVSAPAMVPEGDTTEGIPLSADQDRVWKALQPELPCKRDQARLIAYGEYGDTKTPDAKRRAFNDHLKAFARLGLILPVGPSDDASVSGVSVSVSMREDLTPLT